jgi:hypothetical protein
MNIPDWGQHSTSSSTCQLRALGLEIQPKPLALANEVID